jgi:hypothetical protein
MEKPQFSPTAAAEFGKKFSWINNVWKLRQGRQELPLRDARHRDVSLSLQTHAFATF